MHKDVLNICLPGEGVTCDSDWSTAYCKFYENEDFDVIDAPKKRSVNINLCNRIGIPGGCVRIWYRRLTQYVDLVGFMVEGKDVEFLDYRLGLLRISYTGQNALDEAYRSLTE